MITLEILDYNGKLVTKWDWDENKPIPNKGDTLLVYSNDEYRVNVLRREFDEMKKDVIGIVTDYVKFNKDEIEKNMLP